MRKSGITHRSPGFGKAIGGLSGFLPLVSSKRFLRSPTLTWEVGATTSGQNSIVNYNISTYKVKVTLLLNSLYPGGDGRPGVLQRKIKKMRGYDL